MSEPIVRNAADSKQVRHAGRKERDRRQRELDDVAALLRDPVFRRFAWRLLAFCGYGQDPTHQRGDMTHQNIGMQRVFRFLISEFGEAGAIDQWLLMQREAYVAQKNEQVEAEAIRTPSADEKRRGTADSDAA